MGFFSVLGGILFSAIESGAKSSVRQQYNTAQRFANDTSLSDEQREKARQIANQAKRNMDGMDRTQEKRDRLKNELFNK